MKSLKKDKEEYFKQTFLGSGEVMVNLIHLALNTHDKVGRLEDTSLKLSTI